MLCFYAAKGGSGCTVTAAAVALMSARLTDTLLVDLGGDLALALGVLAEEVGTEGVGRSPLGWGIAGWLHAPHPPPDALVRMEQQLQPGLSLLPLGAGPPGSPFADRWATGGRDGAGGGDAAEWVEPTAERLKILAHLLAGEERRVVVDLGSGAGWGRAWLDVFLDQATSSVLVTRACYLALTRAQQLRRPDGAVLIEERGRALRPPDVEESLGVPVLAAIAQDPAVARAVDAGLLTRRLPHPLAPLRILVESMVTR